MRTCHLRESGAPICLFVTSLACQIMKMTRIIRRNPYRYLYRSFLSCVSVCVQACGGVLLNQVSPKNLVLLSQ